MEVPVACSLTPAGAQSQLAQWRDLLRASGARPHRISPTELSFRLHDDLTGLAGIVRLAQREKACCPFFGFVIQLDADAVAMHVSVPAGAEQVLDGFGQAVRC